MNTQVLRFIRRGELVTLHDVVPTRTLLEVLREDLQCTGTKEGCGEGDCGACTVVVAEQSGTGLQYRAINSCIRLAHSIDGMALWTVEDLADANGNLHPVQEAMVQCHGSQCGFCTPGFVMSLFGLYQNHVANGQSVTRDRAQHALSGNLCRCTGYRPILDAAEAMQKLAFVKTDDSAIREDLQRLHSETFDIEAPYLMPINLTQLLQARSMYPQAQIVAGCTDVGLWVTKMHHQYPKVLDVTRVKELRQITQDPNIINIGAAVTLTDAFSALLADRPQLASFAHRFAGLPVRNSGTLGGNVANGSPIGDSMPLLIALGASVVLSSLEGERSLPIDNLYTGYRKNVMTPGEVISSISIPKPAPNEFSRIYKISKRHEDDISAVCLALCLHLQDGMVVKASIGVGGVAATPVRAHQTEAVLTGKDWNESTVQAAIHTIRQEFTPISDMRASASYRIQVLGNLLQRFWLESQGQTVVEVQQLSLEEVAP
jgi:xanthine dehydrogenase small subunit